ncbi:MAG: hypothetical protein GF411_05145 [Candidatus Lokiarchaeota archaeon]|nr:hypothetical protein [Candidatus Lokiarchaeota archaeon]
MTTDLNIRIQTHADIAEFIEMSQKLGYTGFVTRKFNSLIEEMNGIRVCKRIRLQGRKLSKLKKVVASQRYQAVIISAIVGNVTIANWAAGDSRVDLLTLPESGKYRLKESTARIAADTGTSLEVIISPLLKSSGLSRSIILKGYRDSIRTALSAGMRIVLSSGARNPYQMRSPKALSHIGYILGLDQAQSKRAILETPDDIIRYNVRRLDRDIITKGLEVRRIENK